MTGRSDQPPSRLNERYIADVVSGAVYRLPNIAIDATPRGANPYPDTPVLHLVQGCAVTLRSAPTIGRFLFTVRSRIVTASGWLQACPLGGRSRQAGLCQAVWLPGSASDVGRDDIRGVPVQAPAGPVVADRDPRV